jgi:hypothetical protein
MTGNAATAIVATTPVAMLFVVDTRLFYTMGILVSLTCVLIIFNTLFGCWRRERRLENLKTRAKRRAAARDTAHADNRCCGNDCD